MQHHQSRHAQSPSSHLIHHALTYSGGLRGRRFSDRCLGLASLKSRGGWLELQVVVGLWWCTTVKQAAPCVRHQKGMISAGSLLAVHMVSIKPLILQVSTVVGRLWRVWVVDAPDALSTQAFLYSTTKKRRVCLISRKPLMSPCLCMYFYVSKITHDWRKL